VAADLLLADHRPHNGLTGLQVAAGGSRWQQVAAGQYLPIRRGMLLLLLDLNNMRTLLAEGDGYKLLRHCGHQARLSCWDCPRCQLLSTCCRLLSMQVTKYSDAAASSTTGIAHRGAVSPQLQAQAVSPLCVPPHSPFRN